MIGSIISALSGAHLARQKNSLIDDEDKKNEDQFASRYYNPVSAESERNINRGIEAFTNANQSAAARNAVAGGTDESVIAQKQANADSLASIMASDAASQTARKDAIYNNYQAQDRAIDKERIGVVDDRMNQIAQAGSAMDSAENVLLKGLL